MATFKFSTQSQLRQRLREEFLNAKGLRLHKMAKWANNNLTDAQLRALFGLTVLQATTFRAKLQNMQSRLDAVDAEAGQ